MLLSCPLCASQFKIAPEVLGLVGRKVKCTTCGHIWFQKVNEGEGRGDDSEEIEDLIRQAQEETARAKAPDFADVLENAALAPPQEEGPRQDKRFEKPSARPPPKPKTGQEGKRNAYALSAFVFFIVLSVLLAAHKPMLQVFPGLRGFYGVFGITMPVPGTDLVFDKMQAERVGDALRLTGVIINLSKAAQTVPIIEVSLRNGADEVVHTWLIKPGENEIGPEATVKLDSLAPLARKDIDLSRHQLLARFVLTAKTGAGDDGNTQAPPPGDQTHPNAPARVLESPPHASSVPHPESGHPDPRGGHPSGHDHQTDDPADHTSSHH